MSLRKRTAAQRGFTLLELSIAIAMLGIVMALMYQAISGTIRGRNQVYDALRKPKVANAILSQIFKDFRYIYWGGLTGDAGFRGKAKSFGSDQSMDRVAFITARRTRTVGSDDDGARSGDDKESPLTEVGYACRHNPRQSQWIELYRREDYFVDSKPTDGGFYTLVYDKLRSFRLRYFPTPENHYGKENESGFEEWDSAVKKGIPYAILLKIEFDVSDPIEGQDYEPDEIDPIHRIIILRGGYNVSWGDDPAGTGTPTPPGR